MEINEKKQQLKELMALHYGFSVFRPGQEEAIDNVLAGLSTVIVMPTGGGKSLCYQLPALALDGVTIVISPLIALMKDQVDNLNSIGIPATFINSSLGPSVGYERIEDVKQGKYKLLYIAPERFYNKEFINSLKEIKVGLFAIDEAHCISQWGHDFRPSYLKLKEAIALVDNPPVMALTATATLSVREDIVKQLDLKDPKMVVTGFARPNLQFGVIHAREARKPQFVLDAVMSVPGKTGIIYASTRARVDSLLEILLENDIEAVSYHAGMDPGDRKWVQDNFLSGKAKVIVATNAFGLGIDKPDVRFVIHYDMPGTVEAYYQEAGRAGRDGKPSLCLLLYNSRDRFLHEFFIKGDNPSPSLIREIYDILLSYESDVVLLTYAELTSMLSESMPDMAIGTAIKILEKEGYIARTREKKGKAFIKLLSEYKYIFDTLGARAKKQRETLAKLYERFGDELIAGLSFNPEEVADILEIKKEALMRLVRKLAGENLIEYKPPFKGTEIKMLKRVSPRKLKFDEGAMKEKLKNAHKKLDKIENYIYNLGCRQKYILDYFGDQDSKPCGQCDFCVTGQGLGGSPDRKEQKFSKKYPSNKYRHSSSEHRQESKKEFNVDLPKKGSSLNTKLTQLETLELYNKGLKVEDIAKKRNLSTEAVVDHLRFLAKKGLITDIKKYN